MGRVGVPALASIFLASAAAAGPALHFRVFTTEDGLPQGSVRAFAQTPDGYLWIATFDGLVRFDGVRMTVFSRSEHPEIPSNRCLALFVDRQGALWAGTEDGGVFRLEGGRIQAFNDVVAAHTFAEDDAGTLWAITTRGAVLFDGERWSPAPDSRPRPAPWQVAEPAWPEIPPGQRRVQDWPRWGEGRDGRLWVVDAGYVQRRDGSTWTLFSSPLPEGVTNPIALFEDREGSLWIGGDPGLVQATPTPVRALVPEARAQRNVYTVAEDAAGRVWVGSQDQPLLWEGGKFTPLDSHQQAWWPPTWIRSIESSADGSLLAGGPAGVFRVWPGRRFERLSEQGDPRDFLRDRDGRIWVAHAGGVIRQSEKGWEAVEGLPAGEATVLLESRGGGVWVGTRAGIARVTQGEVGWWPAKGSWESSVRALHEDEAGHLWIGTYDAGLVRLADRSFVTIRKKDGLWDDGVFAILDDNQGRYWMSSNRGIYAVKKSALDDFAEGRSRRIECRAWRGIDGLPSTECNGGRQPSAFRAANGTLWFPTQGGLAILDPRAVRENTVPPPVAVEEVTTDRGSIAAGAAIVLQPGDRRLEVRYTANTFIRPEGVRFRHRLEGLDPTWVEAGSRRYARYAHVPPGRYVLKIKAANSDGAWSPDGVAIPVRVLPYWWETLWFRSGAVVLGLVIVGGGYRQRVAHLKRRRAEQDAFARRLIESQEAERKRIAGELHDGIGQTLIVIRNRALLGARDGGDPRSVHQMDEIASVAGDGIEEVRKVAYGLRPYQLDRLGLKRALEALVEQTAESSAIAITAEIGEVDGAFATSDEINVYRIVQEGVANMIRYSKAGSGRVAVLPREREVEIRIEDDGMGFDTATAGVRGGLGLSGIAERARILGGASAVRSAPNTGTAVIVIVPRRMEG
jgi:signal transduction histidine kinase/ligand-binding sensor domain-containing protein